MADGAAMVATARPPSSDPAAHAPTTRPEILVNFIFFFPLNGECVAVSPFPNSTVAKQEARQPDAWNRLCLHGRCYIRRT